MAAGNNKNSSPTPPPTFQMDKGLQLILGGKRIAPASIVDQNNKVPWWLVKFRAGNKDIVAQVQNGSVNTYNVNNLLELFVEVTDEMINNG